VKLILVLKTECIFGVFNAQLDAILSSTLSMKVMEAVLNCALNLWAKQVEITEVTAYTH